MRIWLCRLRHLCLGLMVWFGPGFDLGSGFAAADEVTLLATTSVENSGFLAYVLPRFEAVSGIRVHAVIAGSGAAIQSGKRGNGDLLMTHSPKDEAAFIAEKWGIARLPFMYNEFVLIGDASDEAGVQSATSVEEAFRRIYEAGAPFVSRSDNSGTDRREKSIWRGGGMMPESHSGDWYWESGGGMSSTFNIAVVAGAYVFGDSATWARFGNKRRHKILFTDTARLKNQYVVMAVNPARHPHVRHRQAQIFIDWLLSAEGQAVIASYEVGGHVLFTPNAIRP